MATINELRDHLFETIKALRDPENPMAIDRAKAIAEVSQVVINTAKVEVDAMKVIGAKVSTGFLPEPEKTVPGPRSPEQRSAEQRRIQRERS